MYWIALRLPLVWLFIVGLVPFTPMLNHHQERHISGKITSEDISKLPPPEAPKVTLKRAIELTEAYAKEKKIDLSAYYLFEVTLDQNVNHKLNRWLVKWIRPGAAKSALLGNPEPNPSLILFVYMDTTVTRWTP